MEGGFPPKSDCELLRTHPENDDFTSKLKRQVGGERFGGGGETWLLVFTRPVQSHPPRSNSFGFSVHVSTSIDFKYYGQKCHC